MSVPLVVCLTVVSKLLVSAAGAPASTTTAGPARTVVAIKDGKLTLDVENQRLDGLLAQIARRTAIYLKADDLGEQRVSAHFTDMPLDEGLKVVLTGYDTFFFYESDKGPRTALKGVWVYPAGQGRALQPIPPEQWASTKEIAGRLSDADPEVRARAVETLVERDEHRAVDAVVKALADADEGVRTRALYGALTHSLALPPELLTQAQQDPSPNVRFLALETAAGGPDGRRAIEVALKDPDPRVRQRAREILGPRPQSAKPAPAQKRP